MCEFCDALIDNKKINWLMRSSFSDDNFCEYINNCSCECCDECTQKFTITSYNYDNGKYVGLEFLGKCTDNNNKDVIIHSFTEGLRFNYCPICGKQISKEVKISESYYEFDVED